MLEGISSLPILGFRGSVCSIVKLVDPGLPTYAGRLSVDPHASPDPSIIAETPRRPSNRRCFPQSICLRCHHRTSLSHTSRKSMKAQPTSPAGRSQPDSFHCTCGRCPSPRDSLPRPIPLLSVVAIRRDSLERPTTSLPKVSLVLVQTTRLSTGGLLV